MKIYDPEHAPDEALGYRPERRIFPPDWIWSCGMRDCGHTEPVLTSAPPTELPDCPQCRAKMVRKRVTND